MTRLTLVIVAVAALAPRAAAQPAGQSPPAPAQSTKTKANKLLERGIHLYSVEADFAASLQAFRASFELRPSWKALTGVGQSQNRLGHYVDAYRTFRKLVADFGTSLTEQRRSSANAMIKELDGKIGRISIELAADVPATVHVTLDGKKLGAEELTGPHLVMPGNHAVVATQERFQPFAEEVTVAAGETRTVKVNLVPEKERIVVRVEDTPLVRRMPRWVPWVTVASGAVIASAGVAFAVSAKSDFDDFDDAVAAAAGDMPRATEVDDSARERGATKRRIAIGLFAVGGVTAAVGIALAIVNQPRRGKPDIDPDDATGPGSTSLVVSPRGVGVSVRF